MRFQNMLALQTIVKRKQKLLEGTAVERKQMLLKDRSDENISTMNALMLVIMDQRKFI
ncbi:hypothetical protein ACFVR2_23425 [Gottfriedia sp. NPDC057991]|uniref:hypothetical protein n=1 Tax=Gottfriedia sp. NPDC057991 TaxID=3346298 RepID=UPI0036D761BA